MCAVCGCGYATYDDIETGAGKGEMTWHDESKEKSEAQ
jgi:hypothetical protein